MRRTRATRQLAEALLAAPDVAHYGYELGKRAKVRGGVLYPALTRFLDAGWLADGWEDPPPRGRPPRRYYRVTTEGRTALAAIVSDPLRRQHRAEGTQPVSTSDPDLPQTRHVHEPRHRPWAD